MKQFRKIDDLPSKIPIFPLTGALVLPRAQLPLNIFEPRYLQMIDDALKSEHRLVGMIQTREAQSDLPIPPLHKIGCAGRITSLTETDDGRYFISIKGVCRYNVIKAHSGFHPYINADIDWTDFKSDLQSTEINNDFNRPEFLIQLKTYFEANDLQTDWNSLEKASDEMLVNSLAIMCPFESEEKQVLLEASSLTDRANTIKTLMEFSIRASKDSDKMQ